MTKKPMFVNGMIGPSTGHLVCMPFQHKWNMRCSSLI